MAKIEQFRPFDNFLFNRKEQEFTRTGKEWKYITLSVVSITTTGVVAAGATDRETAVVVDVAGCEEGVQAGVGVQAGFQTAVACDNNLEAFVAAVVAGAAAGEAAGCVAVVAAGATDGEAAVAADCDTDLEAVIASAGGGLNAGATAGAAAVCETVLLHLTLMVLTLRLLVSQMEPVSLQAAV